MCRYVYFIIPTPKDNLSVSIFSERFSFKPTTKVNTYNELSNNSQSQEEYWHVVIMIVVINTIKACGY